MPSFLLDRCSIWNPLFAVFSDKIMLGRDNHHVLSTEEEVGLNTKKIRIMIPLDVLKKYGAKEIILKKDDVIFREGDEALNYFQIETGAVKMITNSEEGQEFIQGIFRAKDSFGEPPLFSSFPYPSAAVALEPTVIIKLGKENFFLLLKENFEIHFGLGNQ